MLQARQHLLRRARLTQLTSSSSSSSSASSVLARFFARKSDKDLSHELNSSVRSEGIEILAPVTEDKAEILTPAALHFVASLSRQFEPTRQQLLTNRAAVQNEISLGKLPGFLEETKHIRDSEWKVAPVPPAIQDRRVEITGPTERKMIINALNSGASCFMADFEDSSK